MSNGSPEKLGQGVTTEEKNIDMVRRLSDALTDPEEEIVFARFRAGYALIDASEKTGKFTAEQIAGMSEEFSCQLLQFICDLIDRRQERKEDDFWRRMRKKTP